MDFQISSGKEKCDCKVILLFEGEKPPAGATEQTFSKEEFSGKAGETMVVRTKPSVIFIGLGKKEEFEPETLRVAGGCAESAAKHMSGKAFCVSIPKVHNLSESEATSCFVEGALLSGYEFTKYKSKAGDEPEDKSITFFVCPSNTKESSNGIAHGTLLANCTNYTRSINNEPPNVANAAFMEKEARKLAKELKLSIKVFYPKDLEKLGLFGIKAVSSGSKIPGRMIVLEYGHGDEYVFVGKGITFDSGGVSLKPAKDMDKMRYDKSGACAVLGIMKAASKLKIPAKVIGVMALAENMPAGFDYRPGDIFKTGGKFIEILNTDAEGRVILSDALSYVRDHVKKPKAVVDMATLTGACVVTLGSYASGLMTNNDRLGKSLENAGMQSGEKLWQLPMWKEYFSYIKGRHGDLKNVGEPSEAGTITAALFLKEFVGDMPWAHLDIAGTAYQTGPLAKGYMGWGATGTPVRLCAQFLKNSTK